MKTLFIESKYTGKIELNKIKADKLPKNIGLTATVQFVDHLETIKDYLIKKNKKISITKGNPKYPSQILGCDLSAGEKIKKQVDAFLYIGDGKFHPLGLAIKTNKEVFCFNPISNNFSKIKKEEINNYKKILKIKKIKFLSYETIGILVSTKPGQNKLNKALELKKKLEKNKNCYIFVFDTLNLIDLENFPFIEFWVNTACPRIEEDSRNIINYADIE
ncbi:diphthamide synthesis protein [Candidatus Woesearchaeota archaeon]|nr:diphthamide synthesis protein [Candidatus Woesearchaeota archaeon]